MTLDPWPGSAVALAYPTPFLPREYGWVHRVFGGFVEVVTVAGRFETWALEYVRALP